MRKNKISAKELRKMIVAKLKKGYKSVLNSIEIKNYEITDNFLPGFFSEVPLGAMMHISFINCVFKGDVQICGNFKNPIWVMCKDCHFKGIANFHSTNETKKILVSFSSTIVDESLNIGGFVKSIELWSVSSPTIHISSSENNLDKIELSFGKIAYSRLHVGSLAKGNIRIIWCYESSLSTVRTILPNVPIENFQKELYLLKDVKDF